MQEAIIPVATPALASTIRKPEDLVNCNLLEDGWHTGNGVFPDWATWLATLGVCNDAPLRIRHFSDSNLAIQAAIAGLGATLAWHSLVADDLKSGRVVHLLNQAIHTTLGFDLVIPQNRTAPNKVNLFRDWLLEQSSQQRPA